jgi:hypothetical protein
MQALIYPLLLTAAKKIFKEYSNISSSKNIMASIQIKSRASKVYP